MVPDSVREVVNHRLGRLPSRARDVLVAAAAVGPVFDVPLLTSVTGLADATVIDALDDAAHAHLLEESALDQYRFAHALVRDTIYTEQSTSRRVRLHRKIADAIQMLHADDLDEHVVALAYHLGEVARADAVAVPTALDFTQRAGEQALARLAPDEAVRHYRHALDLLGLLPPDRDRESELLVSLGDAQARAGQLLPARQTFLKGATVARGYGIAEALTGAALGFAALSPIYTVDTEAVELLESALSALPAGDHPLRARVLARLANSLFLSNDDARLDHLSSEAVAMARRVGEPLDLAEALQFRHGSIRGPGVMPTRLTVADEMIELARQARSVEHEVQGLHLRLCDLLSLGDIVDVDVTMSTLTELVDEVRGRWGHWAPRVLAMRALLDGELARAEQLATEALVAGQRHDDPDAFQLYAIQLGGIRREQDRAAEIEPGIRLLTEQMPEIAAWRCALVAILAEAGRFSEARELLDTLAVDRFDVLPTDDFRQLSLVLLADGCALVGDVDRAATVLELLRPYAGEAVVLGPALDCYGSAARALGVLATMLDRVEDAEAFLRHAVEFNSRLGSRRWVARSQIDLARLLLRRARPGDDREADELLEVAEGSAAQLGLVFIARLAEELR
jgi:tetratricopeptide (TPR) repeat protein